MLTTYFPVMFPSVNVNIGTLIELDKKMAILEKVHIHKSTIKSLKLSLTTVVL
jgi:hypothetical protein